MKDAVFIFQDFTDADNFVTVTDLLLRYAADATLDVFLVVTGRHADLSKKYASPFAPGGLGKAGLSEQLEEDATEVAVDSLLCQQDGARRMQTFLVEQGLFDRVTCFVVDAAFVPKCKSPLSHHVHVLDFLFDRGDLFGGFVGDFLTPEQYIAKAREIAALPNDKDRRAVCRRLIKSAGRPACATKAQLMSFLANVNYRSTLCYALAPLTGVADVLRHVRTEHLSVMGQLFAYNNLNSASKNLFKNQFNVDADPGAAADFLRAVGVFPGAQVLLFPTELAQNNFHQKKLEQDFMNSFLAKEDKTSQPIMQLWQHYCTAKKMKAPGVGDALRCCMT
jgi:hypothetical protein